MTTHTNLSSGNYLPAPLDALSVIQQQYALLRMAGAVCVVDLHALAMLSNEGAVQKFEPIKRTEAALLINRAVAKQFPGVNAKKISQEFFVSPRTTCYLRVEFNPAGSSENVLNLWLPPSIESQVGCSELIRDFLLNVICSGNKTHFNYLMKYIAHALQYPCDKPGVMVILLGSQGTGKGTLARILRKIWGATFLQVHQIKSVTGDFNASLERAFMVWMDEAVFAGTRGAVESLKSLVTEPVIHINEKFQPARQTNSFHRFFGASNSDFYKMTDRDDRRDFVLRVSDVRKGDHGYWNALNNEIENGGPEAFVRVLIKADLSSFNVREKPNTNELMRQKLKSLPPIQNWWFDCLAHGEIIAGGGWPKFVSTDSAIQGVCEAAGGKASHKPAAIEVAKLLKEFCPSSSKKQATLDGARQRGFLLPALKLARAEFATYMGGEITW